MGVCEITWDQVSTCCIWHNITLTYDFMSSTVGLKGFRFGKLLNHRGSHAKEWFSDLFCGITQVKVVTNNVLI